MPALFPAYPIALGLLVVIDLVWLGFVARSFYVTQLGELMRPQPGWVAAGMFYLVYALGVVHFAVLPGLRGGGWTSALGSGALLGLVAYATYDLSNLATLRGWPIPVTIVDIAWGAVMTALVAGMTCAIAGWLARS